MLHVIQQKSKDSDITSRLLQENAMYSFKTLDRAGERLKVLIVNKKGENRESIGNHHPFGRN